MKQLRGVKYILDWDKQEMYKEDSQGNITIVPNYKLEVDNGTSSIKLYNYAKTKKERRDISRYIVEYGVREVV